LLAGGLWSLAGCATLNTSEMSPACRDQYNACLNSCEPPRVTPQRFPERSGDNSTINIMGETDATACVDECNRRGKLCS
jgi:hypothetical protein